MAFPDLVKHIRLSEGLPRWMPGRLPMLAQAGGSHGLNPILALLACGALLGLGTVIGTLLAMVVPSVANEAAEFWNSIILSFIGIIAACLLALLIKRRGVGLWRGLGFFPVSRARGALVGSVLALIGIAVPVLALLAPGWLSFTQPETAAAWSLVALSFLAFTVQASAEEILLRGWLLPELLARIGIWPALIISSSVFSLLHLANDHVDALALINIALVGVVFGLLVIAQGALWGACAYHIIWNWTMAVGLGIEVSGLTVPTTLLVGGLAPQAPQWLSGGPFGIEASAITSVMLIAQIVALRVWAGRNGQWRALKKAAHATVAPMAS